MGLTFRLGQVPLAIFTDTSNNVGIGAAASGSYKFQVTGTTNLTGALSGTIANFTSNDNNFAFNVELRNTNTGTQALTGFGLSDSSGTRKGQLLWIPSNYVTASLQNSFLVSSVTNIPLVLCADATGAATPNIKFQSGATDKMTLFGTSGNLVIGSSTDNGSKLQVAGAATFSSSVTLSTSDARFLGGNTAGRLIVSNSDTSSYLSINGSSNGNNIGLITNTFISFNTGASYGEAMRITSGGNVGIGTSVPLAKATVRGGNLGNSVSMASTVFSVQGNDQGIFMGSYNGTPSYGSWIQAGREAFDLPFNLALQPNGGNVGIGTSSPSTKLQVVGANGVIANFVGASGNYGQIYSDTNAAIFGASTSTSLGINYLYISTSNFQAFVTNDTERMRITSGGTVLINQTSLSAASAGAKFQVATDMITTGSSAGYFWENRSGGVTSNSNWYGWYTTSGTIYLYNGSANAASISPSTGVYTALSPSDIRIKDNVITYNKGLNELLKIKVKEWEYNGKAGTNKGEKGVGFVANELEEALPEWVGEFETFLDKDDTEKTKLKRVNVNELPYLMINAIQELKAEIEELKQLINK